MSRLADYVDFDEKVFDIVDINWPLDYLVRIVLLWSLNGVSLLVRWSFDQNSLAIQVGFTQFRANLSEYFIPIDKMYIVLCNDERIDW